MTGGAALTTPWPIEAEELLASLPPPERPFADVLADMAAEMAPLVEEDQRLRQAVSRVRRWPKRYAAVIVDHIRWRVRGNVKSALGQAARDHRRSYASEKRTVLETAVLLAIGTARTRQQIRLGRKWIWGQTPSGRKEILNIVPWDLWQHPRNYARQFWAWLVKETINQAEALVLDEPYQPRARTRFNRHGLNRHVQHLSPQERQIFKLSAQGLSRREIAKTLGTTLATVRRAIARIRRKSRRFGHQ